MHPETADSPNRADQRRILLRAEMRSVAQIFIQILIGSELQRGHRSGRARTKLRNINQNIAVNGEEKRIGSCVNIGG